MKTVKRQCLECLGGMKVSEDNPEKLECIMCGAQQDMQNAIDPNLDVWGGKG